MSDRITLSSSTAASTNRFVTSVIMKVGAYTLANTTATHGAGFLVTVGLTTNGAADTLGTIAVVGVDLAGKTVTETITPAAGATTTGTQIFRKLTSVTGAGWVSDGTPDNIIVGQAVDAYVMGTGGTLRGVFINTTSATAIVLTDSVGQVASLAASIAVGQYLAGVPIYGYLKVTHTSTSNYLIWTTGTQPALETS